MNYSLQDLVKPLTAEEIREAIYTLIAANGIVTTNWQPWSPTKVLIHVVSVVLAAFSVLVSSIAAGGFLGLASRPWAVLIARYRYGITDIRTKSLATTNIQLTNNGVGVYSAASGEWTFKNPATGALYVNTEPFAFGIGESVTFSASSVEAGSIATSEVGAINVIDSPAVSGVVCTNTTSAVGLEDASVGEIVALCLARRDARSINGPRGAYLWAAQTATRGDGSPIGVTRVRTYAPGDGTVPCYVATATGAVQGFADQPGTDLGRVALNIQEFAETQSVESRTYSGEPIPLAVVYELWMWADDAAVRTFPGGTIEEKVKRKVLQDLGSFCAAAPIGGFNADDSNRVYDDAIATAIAKAVPGVYRVKLTEPSGPFILGPGQFPILGAVAGTVNVVSRKGLV